jgi:hypothetical protein
MNTNLIKKIVLVVKKIFPFIVDDIKFSPKGKITFKELSSCFTGALKAFVVSTGVSTAMLYEYLDKNNWFLLLLNLAVFVIIFLDKLNSKLKRDGTHINNEIHKSLLDQPIKEEDK